MSHRIACYTLFDITKTGINKDILEGIRDEYYRMYIKPIDDDKTYRLPVIKSKDIPSIKLKYPHFLKDLYD